MAKRTSLGDDLELSPENAPNYPAAFQQFLDAYGDNEKPTYVSLFEVVRNEKGMNETQYIKTYPGDIPSFDEIAELGPGKYKIMLSYVPKGEEKRTSKSVTISVSSKYQLTKPGAKNQPANNLPAPVEFSGGGNLLGEVLKLQQANTQQFVSMMQYFMTTVSEMITKRNDSEGGGFREVNNMVQEIMMSNIEQQQLLVERILGQKYGIPFHGEPDEPEQKTTIFDLIKELFIQYGDQILNAGPIMQKMFRSKVQNSEDYALIQKNPELYSEAYNNLVEENPENKGKLDKILGVLGAPLPDELIANTEADNLDAQES